MTALRVAVPATAAGAPMAVLVDEANDAGVVAWLADRVADDGTQLDGPGGLLAALSAAVPQRQTGPTSFVVTWDPTQLQAITVECGSGCTVAEVRDVCLFIAATCTERRPVVEITRGGRSVACL